MSTEEILARLLKLPRQERARVAEELLSSLEEADEEEVAASWAAELERRSREIAEGKVETVEWGAARTELLTELAALRAHRAAS
ncbi:addiction module protein [Sorangium sp. So ce1182]|uniref:addiction module protein n=1 Tax=unclassified Sorangium TaxID=2621164 RepID=UPI003F5E29EB